MVEEEFVPERETGPEKQYRLLSLLVPIVRGRWIVALFGAAGFLIAVVWVLLTPPRYVATSSFISPNARLSGMAGQFGALAGDLLGGGGDVSVGILQSDSVQEQLVKRFNLQAAFHQGTVSEARAVLAGKSSFSADPRTSIVSISVQDTDPVRARDLANGYLDALRIETGHLALTDSSQRAMFFGQQLALEKDALENAEVELKKAEETTGLIAPGGQEDAEISAIARTQAEITSRQVQLASLRNSATEQNPEVIRLNSEIASLQHQLESMQKGSAAPGASLIPTSKVPEATLEYVRKEREVKYHEALFDALSKEYENARLDEAHDAPVLQVLDLATVPEHKSWPPRTRISMIGLIAGLLVGIAIVLIQDRVRTLSQKPEFAAELAAIRNAARS